MVNLPAFFTSAVARLAKLSRSEEHCDFLRPLSLAKASATPPLEACKRKCASISNCYWK